LPSEDKFYVGFIKLTMKAWRMSEGLISERMKRRNSRLSKTKSRWRRCATVSARYVGKIASKGEMTFIYYLKHEFEWPDVVKAAMGAFPDYEYSSGSKMDGDWEVYHKLLFPTADRMADYPEPQSVRPSKNAGRFAPSTPCDRAQSLF
jgi:hypothetical protein